jgi:multiple sugar transport system permease protein
METLSDSSAAARRVDARTRAERSKARRQAGIAYLFLFPFLILLIIFGVLPVAYALVLSFLDTVDMVFWGFKNYIFVLEDFRLLQSIKNVSAFVSIWVLLTVLGVLALSLILDSVGRRSATVMRIIFFLPGAVTSSAVVVLWLFMLDPTVSPFQPLYGLLNWTTKQEVISGFGLASLFALMAFFAHSGGWIVVLGGVLSGLPTEVMEAARIDGAKQFQLAIRIKAPMIWRSLVLMAILSIAAGLQIFVEPQLMALSGQQFDQPDWSLNQLAFQYAFAMGDFGASAALSTLLVGVSIAFALFIIFRTKFYSVR